MARYEALPSSGAGFPVIVMVAPRAGGAQPRGKTTNTLRAPAEMYPSQLALVHS